MTKQQKIVAIILIGFIFLGIIFRFYDPIISLIWLLVVILCILGKIGEDRLARFWQLPSKQKKNKYPTIEDIKQKYPKRLSQDQLRRQARAKDEVEANRKQAIIDRNIQQIRAHKVRNNRIKQKNISMPRFTQLVKLLNGQDDVAHRLIKGNLKLFPDKTPDWACEKAIADLERDRRI